MVEGEKKFTNVGSLKPGSYVLIDGAVCQIKGVDKSKPGKHGSSKARITAFDIFTGTKKNLLKPTSADAEVPIIKRRAGQVVAVMGNTIQLMDLETYETFDVPMPKDISGLQSGVEVEYLQYGENIKIIRKKGS